MVSYDGAFGSCKCKVRHCRPYQRPMAASFLPPASPPMPRHLLSFPLRQLVAMFLPETSMPATIPRLCVHHWRQRSNRSNANERVKRTKRIASNPSLLTAMKYSSFALLNCMPTAGQKNVPHKSRRFLSLFPPVLRILKSQQRIVVFHWTSLGDLEQAAPNKESSFHSGGVTSV